MNLNHNIQYTYTVNIRVQAASIDKPHPRSWSTEFGKKYLKTTQFEVSFKLYCYKQPRTDNGGSKTPT